MRYKIFLFFVVITRIHGSYIHDIHSNVPSASTIVDSRTIYGGAIGGSPSSGAYSSAQFSQTVSAPSRIHSVISTHHPVNQGSPPGNQGYPQGSQYQGLHPHPSQSYSTNYQNNVQHRSGSSVSHPNGVAIISYNSRQEEIHRNHNNQGHNYDNQIRSYDNQASSYSGYFTPAQSVQNQPRYSQRSGINGQIGYDNRNNQYRSEYSTPYSSGYY